MPDTASYYVAAYIAAAVVYSAYAFSLWRRTKRVKRRLEQQH